MMLLFPIACRSSAANLPQRRGRAGYSVTELVIVMSIIGVLAGIVVTSFSNLLGGAKDSLAQERREMLNQALHRFAQQNYEMVYQRMDNSAGDELAILITLQYRNPDEDRATIGSPYVDPRYRPISSNANDTYRLRWTGRLFEVLPPGTSGTGLLMNFEGTDFTKPFDFPPNFKMAGR